MSVLRYAVVEVDMVGLLACASGRFSDDIRESTVEHSIVMRRRRCRDGFWKCCTAYALLVWTRRPIFRGEVGSKSLTSGLPVSDGSCFGDSSGVEDQQWPGCLLD